MFVLVILSGVVAEYTYIQLKLTSASLATSLLSNCLSNKLLQQPLSLVGCFRSLPVSSTNLYSYWNSITTILRSNHSPQQPFSLATILLSNHSLQPLFFATTLLCRLRQSQFQFFIYPPPQQLRWPPQQPFCLATSRPQQLVFFCSHSLQSFSSASCFNVNLYLFIRQPPQQLMLPSLATILLSNESSLATSISKQPILSTILLSKLLQN